MSEKKNKTITNKIIFERTWVVEIEINEEKKELGHVHRHWHPL
jgi:hypothetical protein